MAIRWNDGNGEFYYDHSPEEDDGSGKDDEKDFRLHLLNLLAGIKDSLNDMANKLYEVGEEGD
jgi:hypothetical protein